VSTQPSTTWGPCTVTGIFLNLMLKFVSFGAFFGTLRATNSILWCNKVYIYLPG